MKFKTYDTTTVVTHRKGFPTIRINPKNGLIWINLRAVELLGLESKGSTVTFLQDEKREKDWYIHPGLDTGFTLRSPVSKARELGKGFNNANLCRSIAESCGFKTSTSLMIAQKPYTDGSNIHAILTISQPTPKNSEPNSLNELI